MVLVGALILAITTVGTSPATPDDYELEKIPGSYSSPLHVASIPGDDRVFVVEQGGRVELVDNGVAQTAAFISVASLITSPRGGEQGLLGMAFHPDFLSNGRFFLAYTDDPDGDLVVREFHASPGSNVADSGEGRHIITVPQPFSNHNGGHLLFGPDGYLYIGVGDGGSGGDPQENAQNVNTLLGKILRIDVDSDDFSDSRNYGIPSGNPLVGTTGADEIWLWGLRNPWRFWIDPEDGRMFVADVGQGQREEVTIVSAAPSTRDLGWDVLEGSLCFEPSSGCSSAGSILPHIEYTHATGQSITGGVVYRGSMLPELDGTYFYADFVQGWIRSANVDGTLGSHWDWDTDLPGTSLISSFGVDGDFELYVVSLGGSVWRLEGRNSAARIGDFDGDGADEPAIRRSGSWLVAPGPVSSGTAFEDWSGFSFGAGWQAHLVGNFDGDGDDDLANYHPSNGTWWVAESDGDSFDTDLWATFATKTGWGRRLVGDFDEDGRDDIANYHPSNGTWWVSRSTGSGFTTSLWADYAAASGWSTQTVGDFNGDGRDDIANYYPTNGTWWVSTSTGSGFSTKLWATFNTKSGWRHQLVGDFNEDGRDDIANYYPTNGTWWVSISTGSGFVTNLWADFSATTGWTTQAVGDFNADGRDDIANYYPANGTWWVSTSTGSGFSTSLWETFTTKSGWGHQLVGDFNEDGRDDIANYHPSNGTWWMSQSTGSGFTLSFWSG